MPYTSGYSVTVGNPTKASDVAVLAANSDYLKTAIDKIMVDSATPSFALANGVTATTQASDDNSTKLATTAWVVANASTSPAGSNTQIQFNNSGSFGASANLTFSVDSSDVGLGVGGGNPHTYSASDAMILIGSTSYANTELTLASAGSGGSVNQISFTDTADTTNQARIYYNHATGDLGVEVEDDIIISTNSTERMRIDEAGGIDLGSTGQDFYYAGTQVVGTSFEDVSTSTHGTFSGNPNAFFLYWISYTEFSGSYANRQYGVAFISGNEQGDPTNRKNAIATISSNSSGFHGYGNLTFQITASSSILQVKRATTTNQAYVAYYVQNVAGTARV